VPNASLLEFSADRFEAVSLVEAERVRLRMQADDPAAFFHGEVDQCPEDRRADAAAAPFPRDCHPADLTIETQAACADRRSVIVGREHVVCALIDVVPLELLRHVLLFDEHRAPNRTQLCAPRIPVDRPHDESGVDHRGIIIAAK